jgi:hypothetical protein
MGTPAQGAPEGGGRLTTAERTYAQDQQIRDAAKWLVGSFAAVGAALIAGSQLSSIGKLPACAPSSVGCARLWVAVLGAVLALVGVVWAVWIGVGLLAPIRLQVGDLKAQWKPGQPIYDYFKQNPSQLQDFGDFEDLERQENAAYARFDELNAQLIEAEGTRREELSQDLDDAEVILNDVLARSDDVVTIANHIEYVHTFRKVALGRLIRAAALAAVGIVAFAWAANPSTSPPSASLRQADLSGADLSGVNLRGADLTGATLEGADLTGADLQGADLTDADIDDVVWSNTTCPDGVSSNDAGGSCENHLGG